MEGSRGREPGFSGDRLNRPRAEGLETFQGLRARLAELARQTAEQEERLAEVMLAQRVAEFELEAARREMEGLPLKGEVAAEVEALRAEFGSLQAHVGALKAGVEEAQAKVLDLYERIQLTAAKLGVEPIPRQYIKAAQEYTRVSVAAAALGVSRDTLKRWHREGRSGVPTMRQLPSGRWVVDAESLTNVLKEFRAK